jgi:hypothetical protein
MQVSIDGARAALSAPAMHLAEHGRDPWEPRHGVASRSFKRSRSSLAVE